MPQPSMDPPHISRTLHAAAAIPASPAHNTARHRCGTRTVPLERQSRTSNELLSAQKVESQARLAGTIEINVRFNIFTTVAEQTLNTSNVPDSVIAAQMVVMNKFYKPFVRLYIASLSTLFLPADVVFGSLINSLIVICIPLGGQSILTANFQNFNVPCQCCFCK